MSRVGQETDAEQSMYRLPLDQHTISVDSAVSIMSYSFLVNEDPGPLKGDAASSSLSSVIDTGSRKYLISDGINGYKL